MSYGVTFRAALLASTASILIGRLGSARPFGTPMRIAERYAWADRSAIAAALKTFCEIVGEGDQGDVEQLSHQRLHVFQLRDFEDHIERLRSHPRQDRRASALRRFDAAQALFTLTPEKFDAEATYPPLVATIMRKGAEGLFELGREQFLHLAQLARDLAEWARAQGHGKIVLVESPLGNCLPCAVVEAALNKAGVAASTITWSFPRNDKPAVGYTVRKSAERLAAHPVVKSAQCVLYVDDALTGSRFLKLGRELRRAVGPDRFAGVAMRFPSGRGFRPREGQRDLSRVETWAKTSGLKAGVVDFPPRELFVVDDGPPAAFEREMVWADSALVAGKRKVNVVFESLEQLERIATDLVAEQSRYRAKLEELWSEDDTRQQMVFTPGLIDETFVAIGAAVNVAELFQSMRLDARAVYADDYFGVAHAPSRTELQARSGWLRSAVLDAASRQLEPGRAGMLFNAINAINESGVADSERAPDRDHDYGQYTIPWSPDLLELNRTLCKLIGDAV